MVVFDFTELVNGFKIVTIEQTLGTLPDPPLIREGTSPKRNSQFGDELFSRNVSPSS